MLAAGCGSSSKSTSTKAAEAATSASAPSGSGYGVAKSTGAPSAPVAVTTKRNQLGTILAAGPKQKTVYLFEADKGAGSACTGACAQVWPPVASSGSAAAEGSAISAQISTITRRDGSKQLAYAGHPLYYYAKDGDRSDAYGQGLKNFGSGWYVLAPSGKKIDKS
jgi:predicted lipoprotein with Yx(FWY)xxD motif